MSTPDPSESPVDASSPDPQFIADGIPPPSSVEIGRDGLPLNPLAELPPPPIIPEEPLEPEHEEEEDSNPSFSVRTHRLTTIMISLNSILGMAILGIPNAYTNTGFVTSTVLLILMSVLSLIATWMLLILGHRTACKGLAEMAAKILGNVGSRALAILTLFFVICAVIAYLIVGGDTLVSWFALAGVPIDTVMKRALLVFGYSLCLPIALSLPRNITFLGYVSTATVFCVLFYVIVMVYEAAVIVSANGIHESAKINKFGTGIFSSLAMFGMSFSLPVAVMPAIRAYNPDLTKRKIVTGVTLLTVTAFVLVSGITGYMMFGETAEANVLKNFGDGDVLMIIVRAGFFVIVTCAYPMVLQTIQAAWSQIIYADDYPAGLPLRKRAVVLFASNVVPLGVAMFLPNAKPVLEVGGGLGGCIVDFVFPAVLWIKQAGKPWSHYQNILSVLLAVFGVVCAVIATYLAVLGAIESF